MADKELVTKQMNRFFQIMAQQMNLDDETAMEIADLYEPWEVGKSYAVGKIVKYGTNADGKTQLYSVLQAHTLHRLIGNLMLLLHCLRLLVLPLQVFRFGHSPLVQLMLT